MFLTFWTREYKSGLYHLIAAETTASSTPNPAASASSVKSYATPQVVTTSAGSVPAASSDAGKSGEQVLKKFLDESNIPAGYKAMAYSNYNFAVDTQKAAPGMIRVTPGIGTAVDVYELASGKNLFTGEELSKTDKVVTTISLVLSALGPAKKLADLAKTTAKTSSDVIDGTLNAEMFRKSANTGAFKELPEPMQLKHIETVAKDAGIGLDDIKIKVVRDPELIGKGVCGYASPKGNVIELYPDAFTDTETLVKTLGHERTHIYQVKTFGPATDSSLLMEFEQGAWKSESSWWDYFNRKGK